MVWARIDPTAHFPHLPRLSKAVPWLYQAVSLQSHTARAAAAGNAIAAAELAELDAAAPP